MTISDAGFDYARMTERNAGFLTHEEQVLLRHTPLFVCGVGGMGGAAVQSLARAGVERFTLADPDCFEISNLNRQVFCELDSVGRPKVEVTAERLRAINPGVSVNLYGAEWTEHLDAILPSHRIVVNGMDDVAASIHLYRKAREHGSTIVDAYTSPLPSVTVVRPADPRPEDRLGFPTVGRDWRTLGSAELNECKLAEVTYVLVHSSSIRYIDLRIAAEMLGGRRSRPSFAPMVITTGNLMAFEAIKAILGRRSGVDYYGAFLNPWTFAVEQRRSPALARLRSLLVRRMLRRLERDV